MCSSKILIKNMIQHRIANSWGLRLWPFQITIQILFVLLTLNKQNFKSRCSTDNKWGISMHWLGNISSQIHPKSQARLPLSGTVCSVFSPLILTAKEATAVLYQDTQCLWATPRQGPGAEPGTVSSSQGRSLRLCPAGYSTVLSFPW